MLMQQSIGEFSSTVHHKHTKNHISTINYARRLSENTDLKSSDNVESFFVVYKDELRIKAVAKEIWSKSVFRSMLSFLGQSTRILKLKF